MCPSPDEDELGVAAVGESTGDGFEQQVRPLLHGQPADEEHHRVQRPDAVGLPADGGVRCARRSGAR